MKYIINVIFILGLFFANAQEPEAENMPEKDSVEVKKPKKDFRPYELKVGVNVYRAGKSIVKKGFSSQEIHGALSLLKYIIYGEFGFENNKNAGDAFEYTNKGSYFRVGFDKNFIGNTDSGNVLALGLRYARAGFNDNLKGDVKSIYGDGMLDFSNKKLNARWFEILFNLRGKLISNLYAGFTVRWQFSRKINGEGALQAYNIPGYGTLKQNSAFMFDYHLAWRIPFKKKKKIEEEK